MSGHYISPHPAPSSPFIPIQLAKKNTDFRLAFSYFKMSTPPDGLPGRRGINPPAPIGTPPPGERIAPDPLTTPSDESPRSSPNTPPDSSPPLPPPGGGGTRSGPITPPDNSPPLPPPGGGGTRSGPITPPVHSPPPQVTPKEKEVRIGNVPFTMLDRK